MPFAAGISGKSADYSQRKAKDGAIMPFAEAEGSAELAGNGGRRIIWRQQPASFFLVVFDFKARP